jgi:hypothetical protein
LGVLPEQRGGLLDLRKRPATQGEPRRMSVSPASLLLLVEEFPAALMALRQALPTVAAEAAAAAAATAVQQDITGGLRRPSETRPSQRDPLEEASLRTNINRLGR